MLRALFVALSKASWAQRAFIHWQLARRVAMRFVAGETAEDALRVTRELNERGLLVTLDHLGEHTATAEAAQLATAEIEHILDEIEFHGVRANVSIKLTQIGLALDAALCRANLQRILTRAREAHNFVRIDMEDSPYTERTLALYREMQAAGFDNCGVVIQSYLYRSSSDVAALVSRRARVRLTKGAYSEPANVAHKRKADVDNSFDRLTEMLIGGALAAGSPAISADGRVPPIPAIATHDERRIAYAQAYAQRIGLPNRALEFQMLYGIRRDLQDQLAAQGYPVRVYVPYGTHWYPYFMRRLAERPANVWFFVTNFLKG